MNGRLILAMVLIVIGAISLAWGGITYTRNKTVVDIGPVQVQKQEHERIPLSPVLGGVILASGVAIALWPRRA